MFLDPESMSLRQLHFMLEIVKNIKTLPRRLSNIKSLLSIMKDFFSVEGVSFVGYDEVEGALYRFEVGNTDRDYVEHDLSVVLRLRTVPGGTLPSDSGRVKYGGCAVPVLFPNGCVAGILRLHGKKKLSRKEFSLLQASSELLGGYLEINHSARGMLAALIEAQDARIPIEAGHSKRVATYAEFIGKKLNLSEDELVDLKQAALLHDIGKIGIPDHIIKKPGRLTPDEYAVIKTHSVIGARILERSGVFSHLSRAVLHHHERWDGMGYPEGLSGENIPLFSRIIAVADAFDAMTSDRPYRRALSWREAKECLIEGAGSQWDPRIVDIFSEGLDEINEIVV